MARSAVTVILSHGLDHGLAVPAAPSLLGQPDQGWAGDPGGAES